MTLRGKILAIILVTLAGLILILFAVSQNILLHSYVRLEEQDTTRNVQRSLNALSDDVSRLETVVGDWAPWDDTYIFIDDLNTQYIESNLLDTTFNNLELNLMMFLDSSGQVVFAKAFELEDQQELPVPQGLAEHLSPDSPIAHHSDIDNTTSGVLLLPEGPMLVASHPILTSEHDGPIKGTLILGRFLDSVEVEELAEVTRLSLVVQRLDEPPTTPDFEVASSALSEDTPIFVRPLNRENVAGYALVEDVYGEPVLMLKAEMPRDIYQQGQTSVLYFVLSLLGAGVVVMVVAMLLLEKAVLSPLSRLSRSVSHIGASGDLSARVTVIGSDELSSLGGEINRMLGALEKSHAALRESEDHYSALVGSLTDAVFKIKGRVIDWCNDRAEEIYGYRKDELVGMKPNILFPVDINPPEFIGEVSAAIKERGYFHGTAKVKRKDGNIIYIEYSISKMPGREPMELVSVARDVTKRKESEAKLNRTMEELARSNAELEQFAYVASHDLQEPLRMVASYTQLLARRYKSKLDEDADEFIGYAVDGATRMQQLINDLLAYSRVGTRGKPFESTDCEEILNKALINLRVAIEENNAVVTHDQLPTVMADPAQLTQLFQNLIGNAVKFHGDNRPEVYVGAQRNCSDWIFSVRDNGIGIDPNDHERIFLIFQRLHGRKEYPGTGIGLTICRKIVDRHKGRIWVESQSGQGATFHFTIPDGEVGKS